MEHLIATIKEQDRVVANRVEVSWEMPDESVPSHWHGVIRLDGSQAISPGHYRLIAEDGREGDIIITTPHPSEAVFQGTGRFQ